jgi:hypothetical protein
MSVPELLEKYPIECRILIDMGKTAQRNIDERNRRKARKRIVLERTNPDDFVWMP